MNSWWIFGFEIGVLCECVGCIPNYHNKSQSLDICLSQSNNILYFRFRSVSPLQKKCVVVVKITVVKYHWSSIENWFGFSWARQRKNLLLHAINILASQYSINGLQASTQHRPLTLPRAHTYFVLFYVPCLFCFFEDKCFAIQAWANILLLQRRRKNRISYKRVFGGTLAAYQCIWNFQISRL